MAPTPTAPKVQIEADVASIFRDATSSLRTGDFGVTSAICSELALDIIEGRLAPGVELNSVDVASRFGASRTPVREALLRLESEGLVEARPRRRTIVARPSIEQVHDIYQLRAHLHALVSELIVQRATASQLDELDQWLLVCEEDVARNDSNSYFWHSLAARNAEALFSGSPELHRVVRSLGLRTLQLRHLSLSQPGRSAASLERHRTLNAAYHARDVEVARESTVDLITSGYIAIEGSMLAGDETSSRSAEDDDSTGGSRLPDPTISRLVFGQGGPHLLQTSTERSG